MAVDAATLIKDDHRRLKALFDRLRAGEHDRRALVEEVAARLTAHARAEEREVYLAIGEVLQDKVSHAHREHGEAEHLLTDQGPELGSSPRISTRP